MLTDIAIQNMLMGYRSTPHPATGYTPYETLMRRTVRTKLDFPRESQPNISKMEKEITKTKNTRKSGIIRIDILKPELTIARSGKKYC